MAQERAANRLSVLAWEAGSIEVAALIVWHWDKRLSPTLSTVLRVVREVIVDGPDEAVRAMFEALKPNCI